MSTRAFAATSSPPHKATRRRSATSACAMRRAPVRTRICYPLPTTSYVPRLLPRLLRRHSRVGALPTTHCRNPVSWPSLQACQRMQQRQRGSTSWPPTRATPSRPPILHCCTTAGTAFPPMQRRQHSCFERLQLRQVRRAGTSSWHTCRTVSVSDC